MSDLALKTLPDNFEIISGRTPTPPPGYQIMTPNAAKPINRQKAHADALQITTTLAKAVPADRETILNHYRENPPESLPHGFTERLRGANDQQLQNAIRVIGSVSQPAAPSIPDVTPRLKPPATNAVPVQSADPALPAPNQTKPDTGLIAKTAIMALAQSPALRGLNDLFGKDSDIGRLNDEQQAAFVAKELERANNEVRKAQADIDALSRPDEELLKSRRFRNSGHSAVGFTGVDRLRTARAEAAQRLTRAQQRLADADGIISGAIPPPEFGPIKNAGANTLKAFANAFGEALPKSAGAIQASITGQAPQDTAAYKIGQGFGDAADEILFTDQARQHETSQQVAQGLGQAASFLTPAATAKALHLPRITGQSGAVGFGALQSGAAGLDEAIAFDADTSQQLKSFYANAGLGLTEAVPINRFLGRPDNATGGTVSRVVKNSTATGLEEMVQEVVQTVGSNVVAKELAAFDEERGLFEGVEDAAKVGGIVGAILGGGGAAISRPQPNSNPQGQEIQAQPETTPNPAQAAQVQSFSLDQGQNAPNIAPDSPELAFSPNQGNDVVTQNDSQRALQESTGETRNIPEPPPGYEFIANEQTEQTQSPWDSLADRLIESPEAVAIDKWLKGEPLSADENKARLSELKRIKAEFGNDQAFNQAIVKAGRSRGGIDAVSRSKIGAIANLPEIPAGFELLPPQHTAQNKTAQTQVIPPIPAGFELLENSAAVHVGSRQRPSGGIATPSGQIAGRSEQVSHGLHNVTTRLHTALGLTARQGRVKRGAAGTFNTGSGVVRTRKGWRSEIDVFSHEGGHALESKSGPAFRSLLESHKGELIPMDYVKGRKDKRLAVSEGFAEFFKTYVTNPEYARRKAPEFYSAFEAELQQTQPSLFSDLQTVQSEYQAFLDAPSAESISGDIVSNSGNRSVKDISKGVKEMGLGGYVSNLASRVYTALVDRQHPFVRTVNTLRVIQSRNLGRKIDLSAAKDPAKLLRLALDSTAAGHMDLIHGVRPYRSTQSEGPGLSDAIETAADGAVWTEKQLQDFGAYLVSRRAVHEWDRYKAGEIPNPPTKHSQGDHRQAIEDFERDNPTWAKASELVYEWTRNHWRKKRDAGLISQETYEAGLAMQNYVPFKRDMSDADLKDAFSGSSPSRTGAARNVRQFRGSDRAIINPIESLMQDAYQTAQTIARNDVLIALDELAKAAGPGAGAIVERLPKTEMTATKVDAAEAIEQAAIQNGMNPIDAKALRDEITDLFDGETTATLFRAGALNERGEPIVYMWRGGERIPLRIGDRKNAMDIYGIFTGLNEEQRQLFVDAAALPTTALRYGVTTSPDFLFANYIRDQISAWILTDVGFKPFITGAQGIAQELTQADISRLYNSVGGIMGGQNVAALDRGRINQEITALRKKGMSIKRFASWRGFAALSEVSETGTRLGIFAKQIKDAKRRGLSDYDAAIEAAFESRDYIDFGRYGSRMLAARRLATFMNAGIQGIDKSMRVLTNDGKILRQVYPYLAQRLTGNQNLTSAEAAKVQRGAKAWAKMSAIGMMGLGLRALYDDDPEYDEFSEYFRATHWMVKLPTKENGEMQWYAITKPFELAFMSNIFERAYEAYRFDDAEAMPRMRRGLGEIFVPPHSVPGVVLPFELWANKKTFNDAPIVPDHMLALEPHMQHSAYASDFSLKLGRMLNMSPARIDHTIQSLAGSWGRNALEVTNQLNPERPARTQATTPILRRFAKSPHFGSQSKQEMFKLASEDGDWTRADRTAKKYIEHGAPDKALEYLSSIEDEAAREWGIVNALGTADDKRLHPLRRAYDARTAVSSMRKEMLTGPLTMKSQDGARLHLTPKAKTQVGDILAELETTYARNALIMLDHPGWAGKRTMDEAALVNKLRRIRPDVLRELETRQAKSKVARLQDLEGNYQEFRRLVPGMIKKLEQKAKDEQGLRIADAGETAGN